MPKVPLTLACWEYDRTEALRDGRVRVEGVELNYLPLTVEETFWRMLRYQEFDAAELSMSSYLMGRDRGDLSMIAIPVFPSRFFRHSCIYVNARSGISEPRDLIGKRMGVPEYQITMAVWARGILEHEYGVKPREVLWFTGGEEQPGREEKLRLNLPSEIKIQPIPSDKTLSVMIETGEIDALMTARIPSPFVRGSPHVRRLIPRYREIEEEYYKRTKIFPIMHTVVLREDLYHEHPWVAQSLYKAFCQAKMICEEAWYESALKVMLPWFVPELEREKSILGDDLWPYGLEANRHVLETLIQYEFEQGLIARKMEPESLFAPNTFREFTL
jgi:4,5-dihydroxyphthalate decarboxylase